MGAHRTRVLTAGMRSFTNVHRPTSSSTLRAVPALLAASPLLVVHTARDSERDCVVRRYVRKRVKGCYSQYIHPTAVQ